MYTLEELRRQNKEISDLIEVLSALVVKQELRSNPYACKLASTFNEKVWMHLVFEDNTIYSELAKHNNPNIRSIADNFHASARETKKLFASYLKLWCQTSTDENDHEAFTNESMKIFDSIRDRVRYESEEIFPLVEKHYEG